ATLSLPAEAVVFLFHQGYTFLYVLAVGGFDGHVIQWIETEREPRQVAPTFADMVDAELRLMEGNNTKSREMGGYCLTLHPDGGSTQIYPALVSGERPLDQAVERSALFQSLAGENPDVEVWADEEVNESGCRYFWIVSRSSEGSFRMLAYVRLRHGQLQRRTYDQEGDELWLAAN